MLSVARIALSILLFFLFERFDWFLACYLLAGLTDVLDGYAARKLNARTSLGAKLDSIGDLVYYAALLTWLIARHGEVWKAYAVLIALIAPIALLRLINVVLGFIKYKKWIMIHTIANKLVGFLIFLAPLWVWIERREVWIVVLAVALLAPIEEFIILLRSDKETIDLNRKGLFF
jgi:CDP-diacylglycerol--glycerol-3-phosphate 3-phosphatidyltransferase